MLKTRKRSGTLFVRVLQEKMGCADYGQEKMRIAALERKMAAPIAMEKKDALITRAKKGRAGHQREEGMR